MKNPWEEISLTDYESHMSLDTVKQLQAMNLAMQSQLNDYPIHSVMIFGIAGGNGLEYIDQNKYQVVYGIDINQDYLKKVEERYSKLSGTLKCLRIDLTHEYHLLPEAELVIANLLIEYIGYVAFAKAIKRVKPQYVSCIIQINDSSIQWVSTSPYLHAFDGLDSIHTQMEEVELNHTMNAIGYQLFKKEIIPLPNGKSLIRLDYKGENKVLS